MLEVSPETIDCIATHWRDKPDECYREGLSEWLKCKHGSWEDVVVALSSPTVGFSDIARTIERDHDIVQYTGASNPTDVKPYGKYTKH